MEEKQKLNISDKPSFNVPDAKSGCLHIQNSLQKRASHRYQGLNHYQPVFDKNLGIAIEVEKWETPNFITNFIDYITRKI